MQSHPTNVQCIRRICETEKRHVQTFAKKGFHYTPGFRQQLSGVRDQRPTTKDQRSTTNRSPRDAGAAGRGLRGTACRGTRPPHICNEGGNQWDSCTKVRIHASDGLHQTILIDPGRAALTTIFSHRGTRPIIYRYRTHSPPLQYPTQFNHYRNPPPSPLYRTSFPPRRSPRASPALPTPHRPVIN